MMPFISVIMNQIVPDVSICLRLQCRLEMKHMRKQNFCFPVVDNRFLSSSFNCDMVKDKALITLMDVQQKISK